MTEKELLKKSGLYTIGILIGISIFWFLFSIQTSFGYSSDGAPLDVKTGSRINIGTGVKGLFVQPGSGSTSNDAEIRIYFGTQSCRGSGTVGYILSGTLTGLPFLNYLYNNGSSTIDFNGFDYVTIDGVDIPSAGSMTGKIDSVGGTGTTNVFTNTTLAGQGSITASFEANGLIITPAEYSAVNNATGEFEARIVSAAGTMSTHAHGGTDSVKISHSNITGTGSTSHTTLDTFYNSKGQVSGIASLDANSLVIQNPANASKTPGTSTIVMTGTNSTTIADAFLSNNVTKLGTPTSDNISEGSTNKYYTDTRVNAAVGSLSVNTLSDVNIVMNENDFVKIVGGQLVAGSSSSTVAWSAITGSPIDNGSVSVTGAAGKIPIGSTTGKLDYNWIDIHFAPSFNITSSAQALSEMERLKLGSITHKHYGNMILDGFSDSTGITAISNGTYSSSAQTMKLSNTGTDSGSIVSQLLGDITEVLGRTGPGNELRTAQSFTLTGTQGVKYVGVKFDSVTGAPSGSVTIRVVSDNAGLPSETLADSNLSLNPGTVTPSAWNDFAFASPGTLTSGVYWIRLYCDNQGSGGNFFQPLSQSTAPYVNGTMAVSTNGTWGTVTRDMAFRVYDYGSTTGSFQSVSYTMPSAPTQMGCVLKLSTATTAISASLSRGGGTFTACPLSQIGTTTDFYYRSTNMIDVTNQSSGQDAKIKINFGSSTGVAVKGFGIYGY